MPNFVSNAWLKQEAERLAAIAMLTTLRRIAASDPNNSKFAVLVMAEAREAIAQAEAAGIK